MVAFNFSKSSAILLAVSSSFAADWILGDRNGLDMDTEEGRWDTDGDDGDRIEVLSSLVTSTSEGEMSSAPVDTSVDTSTSSSDGDSIDCPGGCSDRDP